MISVIVAVARGGVIGGKNRLLWHISEDLRRFKAITLGHPVAMGRRTWESLGRPLPGRTNIVITRQSGFVPTDAEGNPAPEVRVVGSLEEAVAIFPPEEELFIIGGGEIYRQAMALADKLYLTEVEADYKGDTFFPVWDSTQWRETFTERHERGDRFESPFVFRDFVRVQNL